MALNRLQKQQLKPIVIAVGASAIAAIAMMFVPVGLLESITGATGISEMVPATAAPLGDTARALMAFAIGALTLVAVLALLLRSEKVTANPAVETPMRSSAPSSDRLAGIKARVSGVSLPKFAMPKMPWTRNEGDILDLADLPQLKTFDAHPDAPARRPLSASSDLAVPFASVPEFAAAAAPSALEEADIEAEVVEAESFENAVFVAPQEQPSVAPQYVDPKPVQAALQPSLAEMVAQLEAAVLQRKAQLAELEVVAADLAANNSQTAELPEAEAVAEQDAVAPKFETEILPPEPAQAARPVLEAVPSSPVSASEDDMDAALRAALDTLQRMNVRAG